MKNSKKIFIACIIGGILSVVAAVFSVVGIVEAKTREHKPIETVTEEVKEETNMYYINMHFKHRFEQ